MKATNNFEKKINEKKNKRKLKKKESNFGKKKKKKKNRTKLRKNDKMQKKQKYTVDYCCNLQYFMCGGTVVPPHYLDIS
jgi:hypothetical protein